MRLRRWPVRRRWPLLAKSLGCVAFAVLSSDYPIPSGMLLFFAGVYFAYFDQFSEA